MEIIKNADNKNYLDSLPKAPPITILQFQRLLHPGVIVYIKPNNHKTYYHGEAVYIPKDMYDWLVKDISFRKKDELESNPHGSIALFVDIDNNYEKIADKEELEDINEHYRLSLLFAHTDDFLEG